MRSIIILIFFVFLCQELYAQIDTANIQIARDQWGVPHIFAKTDAEAAYGLAWAHCEDNFNELQDPLLISRGLMGSVRGKDGVLRDAFSFLIKTEELVSEKYEHSFTPEFKKILSAYVAGVNRFAETHPEEVLHKKLFPINEKDIVKGYVLATTFISNVQYDLGRLFENKLGTMLVDPSKNPGGSNGFAFSPKKTKDGKTYLVSNSHQPLHGYMAWYEAHVCSEEGWNFIGATFAGGITPFVGTNEYLGWTHCVNFNDYNDVFELTMHPKKKLKYKFDGEWLDLEERVFKGKVKLGFIKLGIRKKFYWSKYGAVIKNKSGYFAVRFPANMVVGAAEQWYRMNKATTKEAFMEALEMQQHPNTSTVYADKKGNIIFIDNGLFPYRNPNYNWQKIVSGDTSATLWEPKFMPMDSILILENPDCGYLYHMNGSGFFCTAEECRPVADLYNKTMGYQIFEVARNRRIAQLLMNYDMVSYQDIKDIKYDKSMAFPLYTRTMQNLEIIRHLSPEKYPDIADVIEIAKKWKGDTDVSNKQAALFSLAIQDIIRYMIKNGLANVSGSLPEEVYANGLRFAKKHLLKHFGKLEIELGALQKHVRGDKVLPIGGVPEAISTMYTKPYKKKYLESDVGDSFIMFVTYGEDGVEKIESINCYGASNRPESPHYSDQMEMYLNKKLKPMTLDKEKVLQEASCIYHPK